MFPRAFFCAQPPRRTTVFGPPNIGPDCPGGAGAWSGSKVPRNRTVPVGLWSINRLWPSHRSLPPRGRGSRPGRTAGPHGTRELGRENWKSGGKSATITVPAGWGPHAQRLPIDPVGRRGWEETEASDVRPPRRVAAGGTGPKSGIECANQTEARRHCPEPGPERGRLGRTEKGPFASATEPLTLPGANRGSGGD